MARRVKQLNFDERLYDYLVDVSVREHPAAAALRAETAKHRASGMQIGPHQGALMALLAQMLGATRTLEIGTYTGYSALAVALALPPEGRVIACDVSDEYTRIGKPFWEQAGVAHKIDLRLGPGLKTMDALLEAGEAGRFDFVFIDADKESYDGYYERALKLLRRGGVVAVDNVLWGGSVADPAKRDADTDAIRALNAKIRTDERVSICMVPVADGLTLALKR
jgi:predicted O-methyltransferase YrrM